MIDSLKDFLRPQVHKVRRWMLEWGRPNPGKPPTGADFSPESMLLAYVQGFFPLGKPNGRVKWETIPDRGVIEIGEVHVSKRLKTYLRKGTFDIRFDERFSEIVNGCADRDETWINDPLKRAYDRLYAMGVAHSVESYQDGQLVGGGYGLAIGRVFFLESMYCTTNHASKVAFVRLAERLKEDGFGWIDCQYLSEHWKRFGAKPMTREELTRLTIGSLECGLRFSLPAEGLEPQGILANKGVAAAEFVASQPAADAMGLRKS